MGGSSSKKKNQKQDKTKATTLPPGKTEVKDKKKATTLQPGKTEVKDKKKATTLPPRKTEVKDIDRRYFEAPHDYTDDYEPFDPPDPFLGTPHGQSTSAAAAVAATSATESASEAHTRTTPELVIAIDFGTTYSGYAYAYVDSDSGPDIHINPNWGEEGGGAQYKTPTRVCVKDKRFHSLGFEAQYNYINSEDEELQLFDNFKMQLYNKTVDRDLDVTPRCGDKMKAVHVFAMVIHYFKEKCLEIVARAHRLPDRSKICWVLTVPAIWGDSQKMLMREAAVQAGVIDHVIDDKLVIALEPESASLYCRAQTGHEVETPGHQYMVVDAGGGTIDITVYQTLGKDAAKEIYQATGGDWGGNKVNEQFVHFLSGCFGQDFIGHLETENSSVLFEMLNNFEKAKRGFNPFTDDPVVMTITNGFSSCFQDFKKVSLKDYISKGASQKVSVTRAGNLQLSTDLVESFFKPVIDNTVNHVRGLLTTKCLRAVKTIFLVGGFGQCKYLQHEIDRTFVGDKNVIFPEDPVLSVLKGAVMYGCNPDLIQSRISPRSYSFCAYKHNQAFLRKIIDKGQSVESGKFEECYCEPHMSHLNSVKMELYASDHEFSEDPQHPSTYKVGEVSVPCPYRATSRVVKFEFSSGGTELKVRGENLRSGDMSETMINFHSNQ